jgi:hypothetical protein
VRGSHEKGRVDEQACSGENTAPRSACYRRARQRSDGGVTPAAAKPPVQCAVHKMPFSFDSKIQENGCHVIVWMMERGTIESEIDAPHEDQAR